MIDIQQDITVMGGREVSRPYRVWFFAEGEWFLSFWRCHRPRKRAALVMWGGWFKPQLEIRHATALTTGAKHWHRRKAVFYVFVSVPPAFIHWTAALNRSAIFACMVFRIMQHLRCLWLDFFCVGWGGVAIFGLNGSFVCLLWGKMVGDMGGVEKNK